MAFEELVTPQQRVTIRKGFHKIKSMSGVEALAYEEQEKENKKAQAENERRAKEVFDANLAIMKAHALASAKRLANQKTVHHVHHHQETVRYKVSYAVHHIHHRRGGRGGGYSPGPTPPPNAPRAEPTEPNLTPEQKFILTRMKA